MLKKKVHLVICIRAYIYRQFFLSQRVFFFLKRQNGIYYYHTHYTRHKVVSGTMRKSYKVIIKALKNRAEQQEKK